MPTYTYQCADCQEQTIVVHGITSDPEVFCEECGGAMARKPQVAMVKIKPFGFGGMG